MIKVAVLWIINDEGEILLAQRAHHKAQDPGVWGPAVTGKLEADESFDDALARETEEEIALKIADYTPHFLLEKDFKHPDSELRKFGVYYTVFPKYKNYLIQVDANEVADTAWFSLRIIKEKMNASPHQLVPSANAVWPATFEALGKAMVI